MKTIMPLWTRLICIFFFVSPLASASPKLHVLSGGFQGLYVVGLGYSHEVWKWDISYGLTPDAEDEVSQINARLQRPLLKAKLNESWNWNILNIGLLSSYALGEDFFVASPDRYPSSSYYLPNGLRMGLIFGTSLLSEGSFSMDFDVVTTDLHLISYYNNPDFFEFEELISVAFSASFQF